ncbi:MAG: hypothetical protein QM811_30125 [Pirellulales bacterium]
MSTISIEVDSATADAFANASEQERRKLELLLGLRLRELTSDPSRSLTEIMDSIGRSAESRGLTAEQLESLLNER